MFSKKTAANIVFPVFVLFIVMYSLYMLSFYIDYISVWYTNGISISLFDIGNNNIQHNKLSYTPPIVLTCVLIILLTTNIKLFKENTNKKNILHYSLFFMIALILGYYIAIPLLVAYYSYKTIKNKKPTLLIHVANSFIFSFILFAMLITFIVSTFPMEKNVTINDNRHAGYHKVFSSVIDIKERYEIGSAILVDEPKPYYFDKYQEDKELTDAEIAFIKVMYGAFNDYTLLLYSISTDDNFETRKFIYQTIYEGYVWSENNNKIDENIDNDSMFYKMLEIRKEFLENEKETYNNLKTMNETEFNNYLKNKGKNINYTTETIFSFEFDNQKEYMSLKKMQELKKRVNMVRHSSVVIDNNKENTFIKTLTMVKKILLENPSIKDMLEFS